MVLQQYVLKPLVRGCQYGADQEYEERHIIKSIDTKVRISAMVMMEACRKILILTLFSLLPCGTSPRLTIMSARLKRPRVRRAYAQLLMTST